ncbi:MAG: DUF493 domain-containing protein [Pseudomonadota bacterium]
MSDDSDETLLEFPTTFPIKVMGRNDAEFEAHATALVSAHTGDKAPLSVVSRESRNGSFLSVTIEITAESKAQLDAIYEALTADDQVVMAL